MKPSGSTAVRYIFDYVFRFSVLMMCINPTERKGLPSLGDRVLEGLRIEKTIIKIVVADCYPM
jgi:hypothetical protein